MKLFLLIISFIFQILSINPKETSPSKSYKLPDIISLLKSCKTKEYKIIDPKDYISKEDETIIEEQLKDIYKKQKTITFLIMLDYIDLRDNNGNNINILNYTNLLIEEFYIQNVVDIDASIIVAVISIKDKKMTMKTDGKIAHIINEQDCFNILNVINSYYAYGEYSNGSAELGKLINYYASNTSFLARNKKFFYMILLLIICFCSCYTLSVCAQKIKERRNLRLTMTDEEKLLKIKDFLKKAKYDRKIISDSCIICLEPFDNCVSIFHTISQDNKILPRETRNNNILDTEKDTNLNTYSNTNRFREEIINQKEKTNNDIFINNTKNDEIIENNNEKDNNDNNDIIAIQRNSNVTDTQISTLPCGHRFHVRCISQWMLQRKNICPMCREKINVDLPDDNDDLQNELLNIQIELHPAFALLVFQTINEELTWGAITLPVINGGLFGGIAGFAFI